MISSRNLEKKIISQRLKKQYTKLQIWCVPVVVV